MMHHACYIITNMKFKHNKTIIKLVPNLSESMYILYILPVVIAKSTSESDFDSMIPSLHMNIILKEFKQTAMISLSSNNKELKTKPTNINKKFDSNTFVLETISTNLVFIAAGQVRYPAQQKGSNSRSMET